MPREPGIVTVRCAWCPDFAVEGVDRAEAVRLGKSHRRDVHGIDGSGRPQRRAEDKAALVSRIKALREQGRTWPEIGAQVGLSATHVGKLARGSR